MSESEVRFNLGPYSHIVIAIPDTFTDDNGQVARIAPLAVVEDATAVAAALQEWFEAQQPEEALEDQTSVERQPYAAHDGDPGPREDYASNTPGPRRAQQPQQQQQGGGGEREQMLTYTWGECPDCGVESKPSILKYQEWETDDAGNEVPAKHFCGNNQCQRRTLWRRELIIPSGGF